MTDLDHQLARLGAMPLDPRLAQIDEAVLAGLAAARQPAVSGAMLGAMVALAMAVGMLASATLPGQPALAASAYPPGTPSRLVPSTLLGDAQ